MDKTHRVRMGIYKRFVYVALAMCVVHLRTQALSLVYANMYVPRLYPLHTLEYQGFPGCAINASCYGCP